MKIVFVASGISPHISPMCDCLFEKFGEDFRFFGTDIKPIEAVHIMGAGNLHKEKKYFYNINDSEEYNRMSFEWVKNADVAIIGCSNCYHYMDYRFNNGNGLTFKLRERLFKEGYYDKDNVRLSEKVKKIHLHLDKNLFFLSAGIYAPYDLLSIGVDKTRIIKWGYFPQISSYAFKDINRNYNGTIKLVWFGRFVREKLALNSIRVVEQLLIKNYDIELSMIGYGDEEKILKDYVNYHHLGNKVFFLGAMNENQIREELRKSHIFLMTSNYEEGWGAVVNEAMSEGCVPLVSLATGASQLILESQEKCGDLFYFQQMEDFEHKLERLVCNRDLLKKLSYASYFQVANLWNAKVATNRLLKVIDSIEHHVDIPEYKYGPCSRIHVFANEHEANSFYISPK